MRIKTLVAGFGVALIAAPIIASAASVTDLQTQISALLSEIQALQAQGNASTSVSVTGSVSGSSSSMIACPVFLRSLSFGTRGSDVSSLQNFLQTHGYLNVSATGYFGALTRSALGRWQSDNGIVVSGGAGFGVFGPMSRSFYARFCGTGDDGKDQQPFSADPRSGQAPLSVTFTTGDSIVSSSTYSVDFGDGTSDSMTKGSCVGIAAIQGGQGGIRCSYTVTHTYSSNGTYTAKLLKQTLFSCPAGLMCAQSGVSTMMIPFPQTVGTVQITVGSGSSNDQAFSADPQSGPAPLAVMFSTNDSITASSTTYSVDFGDGSSTVMTKGSCIAITAIIGGQGGIRCSYSVSHTYASNGTYKATLMKNTCPVGTQCFVGPLPVASTTITVTTSSGTTTSANIQKINAPGTVTLAQGGIAEVRNESYYFTLTGLTSTTATIQITPVGCWNSFPSDTPPQIRCMIATLLIPPQTLTVGETSTAANKSITFNSSSNGNATFMVNVPITVGQTAY